MYVLLVHLQLFLVPALAKVQLISPPLAEAHVPLVLEMLLPAQLLLL